MFSLIEQVLMPIFVSIFCTCIVVFMYFLGKKPLASATTFSERMELWYTFVAANLLGKFLFFSLPDAIGPSVSQISSFVSGMVMIGFFLMYIILKCDRVNHQNPNYVTPTSDDSNQDFRYILDGETMEIQEYTSMTHVDTKETANSQFVLLDERAQLRKRRIVSVIGIFMLILTCVLEGIFIVFKEPYAIGGSWVIFVFFLIDKIMETLSVTVILLYGLYQTKKGFYIFFSSLWLLACLCSTIPVCSKMTWEESSLVVTNIWTNIFYAFSAGIVFFLFLYFVWIDKKQTTKRETTIRLLIFGITGVLSWICGIFV